MKISSLEFEYQTFIPSKFTCDGQNVNPAFQLSDVPVAAKSLALVVADPDAPSGNWVHWILINLPPDTENIYENSDSGGIPIPNSFDTIKYGGPCPPSGTHRYFFNLYALDKELDPVEIKNISDFNESIKEHIIEEAKYIGLYSRRTNI